MRRSIHPTISPAPFTIGRLARIAGVGVETIRFYQRCKLLEEPLKPISGYRHYSPEASERIRFIKRAQELGFSLKEIAMLLKLGAGSCTDTKQLAEKKLAVIEGKISDLQAMQTVLRDLVRKCKTNPRTRGCPIVSTLTEQSKTTTRRA